jgi:hypothetical protein
MAAARAERALLALDRFGAATLQLNVRVVVER